MKSPEYRYQKAFVPEHLTKLTIENLPLDKVFFVEPGERDAYEETAIFVSPDRHLMMSKTYAIDYDSSSASNPLGCVGICRVALMHPETMQVRDAFIADLRFIGDHDLVDSDEVKDDMNDQEEFMDALAAIENAIPFDAFIALEPGQEFDERVPKGSFYGDPELYLHLKKLRKKGDKAMSRFRQVVRQSTSPAVATPAEQDVKTQPASTEKERSDQSPTDLSVKFSHA